MARKSNQADKASETLGAAPGYYAKEEFRTQYAGQMLSYQEGDEIPENVGEFLHRTGSPVEKREG